MEGTGGDEVEEAGAAVELGEEDGGIGLGVGAADPLQARPDGAARAAALAEDAAAVAAHSSLSAPTSAYRQGENPEWNKNTYIHTRVVVEGSKRELR